MRRPTTARAGPPPAWTRGDLARLDAAGLAALPVTSKHDLRRDPDAFVASAVRRRERLHRYSTSGSTGTPITAICTSDAHRRFLAARDVRSFGWAGASIRFPRAMVGGRMVVPRADSAGPFHRYNFAERQVYFSAYHISPSHVPAYVQGFNRYRPRLLTGYAHSYFFLARMMLAQGLQLDYRPDCLVLSSEKLTAEMKRVISLAFRARPFEEYGSVENCALATECEAGGMHVNPDFGVVEIVDERGAPVPPGVPGRILATGLLNEAQPLIRYDLGDIASWSPAPVPLRARAIAPHRRDPGPHRGRRSGTRRPRNGALSRPLHRPPARDRSPGGAGSARPAARPRAGCRRLRAGRGTPHRTARPRPGSARCASLVERVPEIERTARGKFRAVISRVA